MKIIDSYNANSRQRGSGAVVSAGAALDPVCTFPRPECGRLAHGLDEK